MSRNSLRVKVYNARSLREHIIRIKLKIQVHGKRQLQVSCSSLIRKRCSQGIKVGTNPPDRNEFAKVQLWAVRGLIPSKLCAGLIGPLTASSSPSAVPANLLEFGHLNKSDNSLYALCSTELKVNNEAFYSVYKNEFILAYLQSIKMYTGLQLVILSVPRSIIGPLYCQKKILMAGQQTIDQQYVSMTSFLQAHYKKLLWQK